RRYLLAVEAERAEDHRVWVEVNLPRFARTLELVPPGAEGQRCLEIGARPFTFTLLMRRYRPFDLALVDYFAGEGREYRETLQLPTLGETHEFTSVLC